MAELSGFQIGQVVELQDGRTATVQYIGTAHFAAGDWLGVELDDATGKNDGAVQGERYFTCSPGYGMFVRPAVAQIIDQPTPRPPPRIGRKANGTAIKGRPSSAVVDGLRRQSTLQSSVAKRQSINAGSPTQSTRGGSVLGSRSQTGSPSKQIGLTTSTGNAPAQAIDSIMTQEPPSTAPRSGRISMAPPPTLPSNPRQSRQSIAGVLNGSNQRPRQSLAPSREPASRLSVQPKAIKRLNSISGESSMNGENRNESPAESQGRDTQPVSALSPTASELQDGESGELSLSLSYASGISRDLELPESMTMRDRSPPTALQRPPTASSAAQREVEDLKTKLRLMEKRRAEDREKLKTLDRVQNERDKFESIIQKLQAKYQPQQQEITNLRKQVKDAEAKAEAIENEQAEHESTMEMITLDREMAEEISESMKTELVALRQKQEELELEVEILREENQELGKEISPEERTSQGWLQMEKSNERLREALVRLRDVAQQQEESLKAQVKELEKDVEELDDVKAQCQNTKQQLVLSESVIEDLRQQLDTTLGAEEMIEELTEKNLVLSEQLDSMRAIIEDLESLKELNDELEMNHNENEKQMQDEIDYKDSILSDNARRSAIQDQTIEDLEYTLNRFRDLVTNLQSDLEDMRASKQITESEANELSSRSRAMLDLNMRLQISANKAQVKAIDLELRQMEATESAEHLAIVQQFLPDSFLSQSSSVLALLCFRRIGFKAKLMHGVVKERIQGQISEHEDEVFASCDILDKLIWIAMTVDRFLNTIQCCSLEAFAKLEGALYDLEPVERNFNAWIDSLKKSEFKEQQCAGELQRSIALITHLTEIHIPQDLEQYADEVHMRATMMQSHLENAALTLSVIKSMVQKKIDAPIDDNGEEDDQPNQFFRRADALVTQIRSAKVVAGKAVHSLEELKLRSLTLNKSTSSVIELAERSASNLVSSISSSGLSLFRTLTDDERDSAITYREVSQHIYAGDSTPLAYISDQLQSVMSQVQTFYNLTTSLNQTVEFPSPSLPPPWHILAQNIRSASGLSAKYEAESVRLKEELSEKNTALALKDKTLEEMGVNIEVLEKRIGESGGRREKVRDLEGLVSKAQVQEREMAVKITQLQQELKDSELERENWKRSAHIARSPATGRVPSGSSVETTSEASLREIAQLKTEIQTLQSSIRYLRSSSHSHGLSEAYSYLTTPLVPPLPAPTNLQIEAKDVLKEMLALTTRSDRNVITLQCADQGVRLKWRPARETSSWKVRRQREEWEEWKEWRDEVVRKDADLRREERRRIDGKKRHVGKGIAKMQFQLPDLGAGQKAGNEDVKIIRPREWEDLELNLGIAAR